MQTRAKDFEPPTARSVLNCLADKIKSKELDRLAWEFGPTELQEGLSPTEIARAIEPVRPIVANAQIPRFLDTFVRRTLIEAYKQKYPRRGK